MTQPPDWNKIAADPAFKELQRAKRRFIVPATVFFIVYYFALPLLVGYRAEFMQRKLPGGMNLAYVFALSQFFMAWVIAALYVRAAARWDKMSDNLLERLGCK